MRWHRRAVYDVLHKTTVTFLIGFSAVGFGYLGFLFVRYLAGMNLSASYSLFGWF